MEIGEDPLKECNSEDRLQLVEMAQSIREHFEQNKEYFWRDLSYLVTDLAKKLNYPRIFSTISIPISYHRISLLSVSKPIDVVVFVFKLIDMPSGIILIHTYNSHNPNHIIFNSELVENPIDLAQHVTIQTPIHNHNAICHSYVAWLGGDTSVWEQTFRLQKSGSLYLSKNEELPLHDCKIENSVGKVIHRLTVDFGIRKKQL